MDNPDVGHLLSLFLGRAIVDEVLPPKFLTAVLPFLDNKSLGVDIVQATGTRLLPTSYQLSHLYFILELSKGKKLIFVIKSSHADLSAAFFCN